MLDKKPITIDELRARIKGVGLRILPVSLSRVVVGLVTHLDDISRLPRSFELRPGR